MPATVIIEGMPCHVEKLASGNILIQHTGKQVNAMHGPATSGRFTYEIHPCQRYQYEWLNSQLPMAEREGPACNPTARPWWSLGAGERANLRE